MFNRFDRISACDGQIDGQIDGHIDGQTDILRRGSACYAYASRGNKKTTLRHLVNQPATISIVASKFGLYSDRRLL